MLLVTTVPTAGWGVLPLVKGDGDFIVRLLPSSLASIGGDAVILLATSPTTLLRVTGFRLGVNPAEGATLGVYADNNYKM